MTSTVGLISTCEEFVVAVKLLRAVAACACILLAFRRVSEMIAVIAFTFAFDVLLP
jgi:hypothetical protein